MKRPREGSEAPFTTFIVTLDSRTSSTRALSAYEASRILGKALAREKQQQQPPKQLRAAYEFADKLKCTRFSRPKLESLLDQHGIELSEAEIMHLVYYRPTEEKELYDSIVDILHRFPDEESRTRILQVVEESYSAGTSTCACKRCRRRG
jgi:hypothetical protein